MTATGTVACPDGPQPVPLQECDLPTPDRGDLLTVVLRANVCESDLHVWRGEPPRIDEAVLGHEALCRVVETGSEGSGSAGRLIEPHDSVVPGFLTACGGRVQ
ncbi:MAG: Zn-dependent alcohol dehydrogenase [uncultured archaeon A07HB70]|nr:MAG: Zn-dependent alcohol dehydrogenase [uncultured archaeon A07HB70]